MLADQQPLVRVDTPSRARIFRDGSGRHLLGMVKPIYNEPACSNAACHVHPSVQTVLGVVDITMDLDQPIETHAKDELGQLGTSFDIMRIRLKEALSALNELTHDLEEKVAERTEQLGAAERKLSRVDKLTSLGQLAASVAHEINIPISGCLNLSMLINRILTDDGIPANRIADFRKYLRAISTETARVGRIVSDLLSFSRRSTPQQVDADLNQIVGHTITLLSHKLELADIYLKLWLDPNLPKIHCDRPQIQQVLINLVMNAAEAIQETGEIRIRTRFIPMLSFIFGQAQLGGTGAIVSLARLQQEFYGLPADNRLFRRRICKEAAHELGYTFGLIQAIVSCRDKILSPDAFAFLTDVDENRAGDGLPGNISLEAIERMAIEAPIKRYEGNIKETAAVLGIDRSTLYNKIKRYDIKR